MVAGTNKGGRQEKRAWNVLLLAKMAFDRSMNQGFQVICKELRLDLEAGRVYETEMGKSPRRGGAEAGKTAGEGARKV
jgi:hypothetical protein